MDNYSYIYSSISTKPINPSEIFNQIGNRAVVSSLHRLIDEKYEELKESSIFFNNFSSLASTSMLIEQTKKQSAPEAKISLSINLFNINFKEKFDKLVDERQQISGLSP